MYLLFIESEKFAAKQKDKKMKEKTPEKISKKRKKKVLHNN